MLNWIKRDDKEPTEPFMSFGWSNQLLAYSQENKTWFEAVYSFKKKKFYLISHYVKDEISGDESKCLEQYGITHFCEEVPLP